MKYFFHTIFGRYLRARVGWKQYADNSWHHGKIVNQIMEVTTILTQHNLQLDDFSNSQTLNAFTDIIQNNFYI